MAVIPGFNHQGFEEWLASRPVAIRELAKQFPPDRLYYLKSSGHRVTIAAYNENGTLRCDVTGEYNRVLFSRSVFGIKQFGNYHLPERRNRQSGASSRGEAYMITRAQVDAEKNLDVIDEWVAEHVMVWQSGACPYTVWRPTYKITHAWEVVEKLRAAGWLVTVKSMPAEAFFIIQGSRSEYDGSCPDQKVGKGKCVCELHWMRTAELWVHDVFAMEETVPLAICRAALRSVAK